MIEEYLNLVHKGRAMEALFHKSYPEKISKHLHTNEYGCKCDSRCDANLINTRLVGAYEATRAEFGMPIMVTSGFRCTYHNMVVNGVNRSKHTRGLAIDITHRELELLEKIARKHFDKVILYKDKSFLHCSMSVE